MQYAYPDARAIPLGVVIRRTPGVTRWARYAWSATAVLPGAGPADWKVLQSHGGVTDYHARTLPLELYVSDTEAYAHELQARIPSIYVVMRPVTGRPDRPWEVILVTASPYEAQDYCDSDVELVSKVAMPDGLRAWIIDFVEAHHVEEPFVKRRRNGVRTDRVEDGIGDPRIQQASDVYRAPRRAEVAE